MDKNVTVNINVIVDNDINKLYYDNPGIKVIAVDLASYSGSSFTRPKPWSKHAICYMSENIKNKGVDRTGREFEWSVAHEFGHVLGLGDAYDIKDDNGVVTFARAKHILLDPNDKTSFEVPPYDVMDDNWDLNVAVTNNDIEMMLQAQIENKWQYFLDGEDDTIIPIINTVLIHNKKSVVITSY